MASFKGVQRRGCVYNCSPNQNQLNKKRRPKSVLIQKKHEEWGEDSPQKLVALSLCEGMFFCISLC